jgi:hypothetical protein
METTRLEKAKPRPGPGLHKLAGEYVLLSWLSNFTGSVFWWSEQRRWRIADQLEEMELQR